MSNFKVVITDCDHESISIEQEILKKADIDFKLLQCKTEDDLINHCKDADGFINQYAPITEKVLKELPLLKFIVRYGVGVNNVDLNAATKYGVQVCNVPDYGVNEVADHALAMMLSLTRKVIRLNDYTKSGIWDYSKSIPIFRHSEQTIGIIGLGRIGTAFSKRVQAMGCRILGYDISYKDNKSNFPDYVEYVELEELIENSDVISIHCPLDNSRNLIDEEQLKRMKKTAYLINVSRGGIINEKALDRALSEGWIAGAGIDVSDNEPLLKDSPLLKHKNLIVTPHMAWYSEGSAKELKRKVAEETVRFAQGLKVHYPINKISK